MTKSRQSGYESSCRTANNAASTAPARYPGVLGEHSLARAKRRCCQSPVSTVIGAGLGCSPDALLSVLVAVKGS